MSFRCGVVWNRRSELDHPQKMLQTTNIAKKDRQPSQQQRQAGFAGDVMTLTSATAVSQIISVAAAPFLAHLFSPDALGVAALFASAIGILGTVVCLRYEICIPLPKEEGEAASSLFLSLACALLLSLAAVPAIGAAGREMFAWLHASELVTYRWLVPVGLLQAGASQALLSWCIRTKEFRRLSIAQLVATACTLCLQILLGLMGHATGGTLILAGICGPTVSILVLSFGLEWSQFKNVSWSKMLAVASRYRNFPKYSIPTSFLNSTSWQLPTLLLARFFSTSVVGQYALGNRLVRIPMNLIGTNIAKVFLQRAAAARNEGSLPELAEKTFSYLLSLSMVPCLLLGFIGKDLFVLVFGPRWAEAGVYTEILSVWVCFWFISSPLSVILDVLEKQAVELRINVLIFASRFISLLVGGLARDPRIALALFSVSGVLVYGFYSFTILRIAGASVPRVSREIFSNAQRFAPAGLLLAVLKRLEVGSWLIVGTGVVLFLLHVLHLIRTDSLVRELVTGRAKRHFATAKLSSWL